MSKGPLPGIIGDDEPSVAFFAPPLPPVIAERDVSKPKSAPRLFQSPFDATRVTMLGKSPACSESLELSNLCSSIEAMLSRQTDELCRRIDVIIRRTHGGRSPRKETLPLSSDYLCNPHPNHSSHCGVRSGGFKSSVRQSKVSLASDQLLEEPEADDSFEALNSPLSPMSASWSLGHKLTPRKPSKSSMVSEVKMKGASRSSSVSCASAVALEEIEHIMNQQNSLPTRTVAWVQKHFEEETWKDDLLDVLVVILIVAHACVLFAQTHLDDGALYDVHSIEKPHQDPDAHLIFLVAEHVLNFLFIAEIVVSICRRGFREHFTNFFSVFDMILVLATSIDLYVLIPSSITPEGSQLGVSHLVRMFRIVRILRLVRVVRLAKHMATLQVIVKVMDGCLPTLVWSLLILGVLNVGSGIFVSQLVSGYIADPNEDLESRELLFLYYGNAGRASYTLFQATFSGMWPEFARPLVDHVSVYWGIFWILFELVVGFMVMQVIGAIFSTEMIRMTSIASNLETVQKLTDGSPQMEKLKIFFDAVDLTGSGFVNQHELEHLLTNPSVREYLRLMDMDIKEVRALFSLLDNANDHKVEFNEFFNGAVRLKDDARAVDTILMMHEQNRINQQIRDIYGILKSLEIAASIPKRANQ